MPHPGSAVVVLCLYDKYVGDDGSHLVIQQTITSYTLHAPQGMYTH